MRRQVACRRVATAFVLVLLPRVLSARGFRERLRRSCDTLNQGVRKLKSELLDASLPPKEEGYVAHGFLLCILCVKLFVTQNERGRRIVQTSVAATRELFHFVPAAPWIRKATDNTLQKRVWARCPGPNVDTWAALGICRFREGSGFD